MSWSIKQNKKGNKCVITCDKGITFLQADIVYNTINQDGDIKGKNVHLSVPMNSWRKQKKT